MTRFTSLLLSLLLGATLTVSLAVRDTSLGIVAPRLPRAATFPCPIFDNYRGERRICTSADVIWDDITVSGKVIKYYVVSGHSLVKSASNLDDIRLAIRSAASAGLLEYQSWASGIHINLGLVGEIPTARGKPAGIAYPEKWKNGTFAACNALIAMPKDDDADAMLRLQKAVVHELYHCVQFGENPDGWDQGSDDTTDWWIEGTARFFDGVVYPIPIRRDILDLGMFPEEYNATVALIDNTYAAALFFHYLRDVGYTLNQINRWVTTKVGQQGKAREFRELAATAMFASNWHGFARAFANNKLNYTSSKPIVLEQPLVASKRKTEALGGGRSREETFSVSSFKFALVRFVFPKGTKYNISVPRGVECSIRRVGSIGWQTASGVNFTLTAGSVGLSVEVLGSCNKAEACTGKFVIERV